jgi:hypothetical protein
MVVKALQGMHNNVLEVLTHVGYTVVEIMAAINRVNQQGWRWLSNMGDVTVMWEDSGLRNVMLIDAVMKLMENLGPQANPQVSLSGNVAGSLNNLAGMISGVDINLAKIYNPLNAKIKALEQQHSTLLRLPPMLPILTMSTCGNVLLLVARNSALQMERERAPMIG